MDKYRKVVKPKESIVKGDEEIRVTSTGSVSAYVSRAAKVFGELEKPHVVIAATGNALTKAVTATEVIKRRFKGLHQITKLGSQEIIDEYEPLEEGLDKVMDVRSLAFIEIKLSKEALDTADPGYQPPIDENLVSDFDPEKLGRSRGRGRGRGRGKGRGKGKGKHDADDDESEDDDQSRKVKGKGKGRKGKGKGKAGDSDSDSPPKGKGKKGNGKGKGKAEDYDGDSSLKGKGKKGKGKGKGKETDSDYDVPLKGKGKKGKSKGKGEYEESPKGKGKGKDKDKGKGKGRVPVEDDYYSGPQKGKGKGKSGTGGYKGSRGENSSYSRGGGWDDNWESYPSRSGRPATSQQTYGWDSKESWDTGYNNRSKDKGAGKGKSRAWDYY